MKTSNNIKGIIFILLAALGFSLMTFFVRLSGDLPTMQKEYIDIVLGLAKRAGITMPEEEIIAKAKVWEMEQGGLSGRTAQQFIYHLLG